VGVAEMKISTKPDDLLVTHALGSCLGIAVFDPVAMVGGILHVMLPNANVAPEKAKENPCMFVDSGTPVFFKTLFSRGAKKKNMVVKIAGGATIGKGNKEDFFAIGKRNLVILRKIFWKNGVMITNQDTGGKIARSLYLDMGCGRVWIQSNGREWDL
jgi:chemotaxis protein CheD